MKKEQLKAVLNHGTEKLKRIPYQEWLKKLDKVETQQFGDKENFYQIETQVFFDNSKEEKMYGCLFRWMMENFPNLFFPYQMISS